PVTSPLGREPHHHSIENDVLASRELHVEAHAELDKRRQASGHADGSQVGPVNAGEKLQQGALAGTVAADDAKELTLFDPEGNAIKCLQVPVVGCRKRLYHTLFERINPVSRDAEGLVQALDLDRQRITHRPKASGVLPCQACCASRAVRSSVM